MNARIEAVRSIGKKNRTLPEKIHLKSSAKFATRVFRRDLIQDLPKPAADSWLQALDGMGPFNPAFADLIADALRSWAMKLGATHFTHWFQPLTHASAEKHEAFLSWGPKGVVLEKFQGKDLLRGEPDASSFPSGGLRVTHEARGYTAWDPTTLPFLWEGGDGLTLCIPTVFFSWKGDSLDHKIPLMRSEEKLNRASLRLLKLAKIEAEFTFPTLGIEQEYFVIDRSLFLLRPDLLLSGKTVFGAKPAKGQEFEDHYFGSIQERVLAFMREFEDAALQIGIPIKTRHSEVAPAQYEITPLFERASLAVDHNVLLVRLMQECAIRHNLACLFHEKPFMGINGSGKHSNFSIATNRGSNLLDPHADSFVFVTLLTAILRAVHEHAGLLRASIAVPGNDARLGGNEAPPPILSVYLGEALEGIVMQILHDKKEDLKLRFIDLGVASMPRHEIDATDRNRTSGFAFTGNKFEFRAVGASAHPALPATVMNAIVADSLNLLLDEIGSVIGDRELEQDELFLASLPVLKNHLKAAQDVIFSGDHYSEDWQSQARVRKLPNLRTGFDALSQLIEKKSVAALQGILTETELQSRYEILLAQYGKSMQVDADLMIEIFQTQILPAAQKDMRQRGIEEPLIEKAIASTAELKKMLAQMTDMGWEAKAKVFSELIAPKMAALRLLVDQLEQVVDDTLWPLPKYRELLFIV